MSVIIFLFILSYMFIKKKKRFLLIHIYMNQKKSFFMLFSLMSLAFYLCSKLTPSAWSCRLQIYITKYKADKFVWNITLCLYISRYTYILSLSVVAYQIFNNRGYLFNIVCDNSMIRMLSR